MVSISKRSVHFKITWANENGGKVTAIMQVENGAIRTKSKTGVTIQNAQKVGDRLERMLREEYL